MKDWGNGHANGYESNQQGIDPMLQIAAHAPCPQWREAQGGPAPLPGQLLPRGQQAHQVRALPLLLCWGSRYEVYMNYW